MYRMTVRKAATQHRCECGAVVPKGDRYIEHVAAPFHDDIENLSWIRVVECQPCAERYGRGALLAPAQIDGSGTAS